MTDDLGGLPHPTHSLAAVTDPVAALRDAAAALPDGDAIVLRVPNAAHVDVRLALLQGSWIGADDARPLTRRSLFALARAAGLVATELHRVTAPQGSVDGAPADPALAPLVQQLVLIDPNALTAEFVVVLRRPADDGSADAEALDAALTAEEDAAVVQVRTLVAAQQREQAELLASRQELIAVQNGKLMRWSQFPRRIYRRLRRLLRLG